MTREQQRNPQAAPTAPAVVAAPAAAPPPVQPAPQQRVTVDSVPIFYDGMDEVCSICTEPFLHEDRVCRLTCRHIFHTRCWDNYMRNLAAGNTQYVACPNCRGAGVVIAVWRYIGEDTIVQPGIPPIVPASDPPTQAYEIGTPPEHSPQHRRWPQPPQHW